MKELNQKAYPTVRINVLGTDGFCKVLQYYRSWHSRQSCSNVRAMLQDVASNACDDAHTGARVPECNMLRCK